LTLWLLILAPLSLLALVAVVMRPALAIWLTIFLLFFGDQPSISALGLWGRYLPTVGVAALLFAVSVRLVVGSRFKMPPASWSIGYALFVLIFLMSVAYNRSSPREIAEGFVTNLRYPIFFLAVINADLSEKFFLRALNALRYLALVQVPVTMFQFAKGLRGDSVLGTLGSGSRLVEVLIIGEIVIVARALATRQRMFRPIVECLLLVAASIMADAEIMLVAAPLVGLYMFARWYGLRRFLRLAVRGAVILGVLGWALFYFAGRYTVVDESLIGFRNVPEYMRDWRNPDVTSYTSIGRATILLLSWPLLEADPLRIFWGYGPEATQGGTVQRDKEAAGLVCRELMKRGVVCRESQSFRSLMEYGVLGIIFFNFPVLALWRRSILHVPRSRQEWFTQYAFEGSCFFYLAIGFWYSSSWRLDTYGFSFWFSAAAMWCVWRQRAASVAGSPVAAPPPLQHPGAQQALAEAI